MRYKILSSLWNWNLTPQLVIRTTGPLGRNLVRQYCTRRFPQLSTQEQEQMFEYLRSISSLDGSGEYAMARLLQPGAWARRPIGPRLSELKMPVVFLCKFSSLF